MKNFWQNLAKPIYALAPMAGITDSAFRQTCKQFGADVVYSEMASAAGLFYNPEKTLALLEFNAKERPYVVQLFGSRPEHFIRGVKLVEKKIKPDGIDLNFGCPVKKIIRQGAGAALMNNIKLVRAIIKAALLSTKLPVSIKCRARVDNIEAVEFLKKVSDLEIKAVMIHGRAMSQGNSGKVDWRPIKLARPLVKGILLANGGVQDRGSAEELLKKTGADGLGIGQGALGRPWLFQEIKNNKTEIWDEKMIFKAALRHAKLADKLKGGPGILEMRKHLCWYVRGLARAGNLRKELVKVKNYQAIKTILK